MIGFPVDFLQFPADSVRVTGEMHNAKTIKEIKTIKEQLINL